jgi:hypothetical protein
VVILSCGKIWFREGEREISIFSKFQIFSQVLSTVVLQNCLRKTERVQFVS